MKHALLASSLALGALSVSASTAGSLDDLFLIDGRTLPSDTIDVGSALDGLLESVTVERGDAVRKGDVIATLDLSIERTAAELARVQSERTAAVDSARVRVEDAERRLERRRALYADGILPADELETLETQLSLDELALVEAVEERKIAELEYERALAVVERGTIRCPSDGVVVERFLSGGELFSRTGEAAIVQVARLDPLFVDAVAPIDLWARLEVGMTAEVLPENPIGGRYEAVVTAIDRVVDTASGTFDVRLELANPDGALPAGLRCRVRLLP